MTSPVETHPDQSPADAASSEASAEIDWLFRTFVTVCLAERISLGLHVDRDLAAEYLLRPPDEIRADLAAL